VRPPLDLLLPQVDGGISCSTACRAVAAGANILVAGSTIFSDEAAPNSTACRAAVYSQAIAAIALPLHEHGYIVGANP